MQVEDVLRFVHDTLLVKRVLFFMEIAGGQAGYFYCIASRPGICA
ncbi:MAG: hypothetical protein VB106_09675 [Clostridiaceae bacterium]|jgi:hypothetical protein|nr:hypothetical protein [Clostridiaceae bacterium]